MKYQFIPHTPNVKKYDFISSLAIHGIDKDYNDIFEALELENIKYKTYHTNLDERIKQIENGFIIFSKGKSNLHIAPIKDKIYYDKKDYRTTLRVYGIIEIKKD